MSKGCRSLIGPSRHLPDDAVPARLSHILSLAGSAASIHNRISGAIKENLMPSKQRSDVSVQQNA